jgi:hypothetical protein
MKGVLNTDIPVPKIPTGGQPADNTAAVITLAAAAGVYHHVDKVFGGYDKDPGAEKTLTIALTVAGTAVTMTYPISSADASTFDPRFNLDFNPPLQGDENKAITITLAAGGVGVAGKLNAITR